MNGEWACCQLESTAVFEDDDITDLNMLVNCQACVDTGVANVSSGNDLISRLWAGLVEAGEGGITKQKLKARTM